MAQSKTKRRLIVILCFGGPIVVVKAIGFLYGGMGPAPAAGNPAMKDAPLVIAPQGSERGISEEEKIALQYAGTLAARSNCPSPFYHPPEIAEVVVKDDPPPVQPVTTPPELDIEGFISSGPRAIAMIDGRPRRAGDTLAPGWRLVSIDVIRRSITIMFDETGEVFVIAPKKYDPSANLDD